MSCIIALTVLYPSLDCLVSKPLVTHVSFSTAVADQLTQLQSLEALQTRTWLAEGTPSTLALTVLYSRLDCLALTVLYHVCLVSST